MLKETPLSIQRLIVFHSDVTPSSTHLYSFVNYYRNKDIPGPRDQRGGRFSKRDYERAQRNFIVNFTLTL